VTEDPVTVFGIGDMSGDVFGNGLLYTNTLKLRAAFNHLHIFLDPDPDPALSFAERERLFRLPRSSWEDYDRARISEGGGVYSRFAKRIPLSLQVRAMLGVDADALSGQDLIRAVLKMPADLFWNGGVGTYVKASFETHAEVGDSSNNAVRIDAAELRARVVGEGGNLGFTQLARVEYARAGGRINTDAVDNSAGVDMSDHEVNLKILLQPLVSDGTLTFGARNALLREMTPDVSALVLGDNARQALSLSLAERRSARDPALFASLQAYLVERGGLRPAVEFLPSAKTALERGYTRPELAVLMAYTKMGLYRRLLETDFPDEPGFQHYLFDYFPDVLQNRYPEAITAHPLRREIIATQFANVTVDTLGVSFVHKTLYDTGSSPAEVVRAALLALEVLDAPALLARVLESAAGAEAQYDQLDVFVRAVEEVVAWLLLGGVGVASVAAFVASYHTPLTALRRDLRGLLSEPEGERYVARQRALEEAGFAPKLAVELSSLPYLPSAMGVIDVARDTETPIDHAARRFYALGERLSLGLLRDTLAALRAQNKWEKIALSALVMELRQVQVGLSARYIQSGALDPETFLAGYPRLLRRYDATLAEVRRADEVGLASGGVLRGLLQGMLDAD
jgi:glutamate dehydrogenase